MTAQKPERNYGIDLLRILAMYLVTVLHVLGGGNIIKAPETAAAAHEAAWLLESFATVAVNCFALISGYVGLRAKHGVGGFLTLYVQAYTYSAGIMLAAKLLRPEWLTRSDVLHALLPVGYGEYWYFTAYCALFLFMPMLNAAAEHLSRMQFLASAGGILMLFSVYRSVLLTDIFNVKSGYTALWVIILYYIGAGIRKHFTLTKKAIPLGLAVYIAASVLGWVIAEEPNRFLTLRYDSITAVLASFGLFCAAAALPVRSKILQKVIAFISPLTFAVYLIHTHPLLYQHALSKRLERWALYSPQHMIFNVLATAGIIFCGCAAVEWLRVSLMKLLHWKQAMKKLDRRLAEELRLLAEKYPQNQNSD